MSIPRPIFLLFMGLLIVARAEVPDEGDDARKMKAGTFSGLELRNLGPAFMSGRIADIAVHPEDSSTWYVAVGSGNLWKTVNAGTTWEPIFDDAGSYSLGCVTVDPSHPEIVWLGTGENVGGRHVGYGDGVYRSRDGGRTWKNVGLKDSQHIGTILVDPRDSDAVLVAAQGPLWSAGGDRGLYRTVDGGETWAQVLGGGEYTGVNEVVMDPSDPDVLYASTHQRFRNVAALVNGGPESGIHKSVDGGETWVELTEGLPKGDMGKIGLAVSPQRPDVVYAAIELPGRKGGFWRSENAGGSWEKRSDHVAGGTGPHYYQEIFASPHAFDRVYFMEVRLSVTENGGKDFRTIEGKFKHVDNHALAFDPADPDYLLAGCDGGLYQSWDLGQTWKFTANLPVTQFYKVAVDYAEPFYNVYGGTQDNNSQAGPSRTDNVHGIRNSDWSITLGGDGHQPAADPSNPNIVYAEWQRGNLVRHDRLTGENVYIQPQPAAGEPSERFNWDSPILISPHDPARLFFASQRVWKSDDRGDSWTAISDDLTRGLDRLRLPMMGRVQSFDATWDLSAMSQYGTITSLSQSPLEGDLIYAGTDDGRVQVTEDGGATWREVGSLPGVPEYYFVNDIKADLHDPDTVYVVVDNHKAGDFAPYVLKSDDRGLHWVDISGDLPERHILWRIVQDHVDPELLFLGTELGLFFTVDGGEHWVELTGGVPTIPFRDLVIQKRENDLVGATFGRGFYVLDDYSALREVSEESLADEACLFGVRKAWWYLPRRVIGGSEKGSQGDSYFVAPNPPFGAVFTYYLRDSLQTRKHARREVEKKLAEENADAPYPGWDELRRERLEEDPEILLTVRDPEGEVIRRLSGPAKKGFHRVSWDLRRPSSRPWRPQSADEPRRDRGGSLVLPGTYTVSLAKRVGGKIVDLEQSQSFEVVPLRAGGTLRGATPEEIVEYQEALDDLQRRVGAARSTLEETLKQLGAIREVLMRSTTASPELGDRTRALEAELHALQLRLVGDEVRQRHGAPGPVSISGRMWNASNGAWSLYGPTPTQRDSFAIAQAAFAELETELARITRTDLPALHEALDEAGVPWSPGRR